MKRIAVVVLLAVFATVAQAQSFFTFINDNKMEAWWLRAAFNPTHAEVRGIPVAKIRKSWCKATEFTTENMKDLLAMEQAGETMKEAGLSFAVAGHFDRSKVRQVALTGVYQACGGEKGSFLLIIDEGTNKVRFVDEMPGETQFAAVGAHKNDIVLTPCLECDSGTVLRWNAKKKAFGWAR